MPERCMRPTIVPFKRDGEKQLAFIGGFEARHNLHYSPKENKWSYLSKIPEGHNITTTVCCNFKDEAIFTFMTDAQLNFKSAVLDLKKTELAANAEANTSEMKFAFK